MTNHHHAEFGDVWKHLPLAEVLGLRRPTRYWESHAGSARYDLTRDPSREFGIFHVLDAAEKIPVLDRSRYLRAVRAMNDGDVSTYPGSSHLAMSICGQGLAEVRLADTDPDSVADLRAAAEGLGLGAGRLHCAQRDGVEMLDEALDELPAAFARSVLALVDPFQPFDADEGKEAPVHLAARLAAAGVGTILWYGFDDADQRRRAHREITGSLADVGIDANRSGLWCGEVALVDLPEGGAPRHEIGCGGCGLLVANLGSLAVDACRSLGEALEVAYKGATRPDGSPGALAFTEPTPW